MPDYIVIRLHPTAPTTGAAFTSALQNLVIRAYDVSFSNLQGQQIGQAQYSSTIVQHPDGSGGDAPVATALIAINEPPGWPEFRTSDVILRMERNGLLVRTPSTHYNISVTTQASPPPPDTYLSLQPVGAYLALPPAGVGMDPNAPYVDLPADGTPPNFAVLRAAVEAVLAQDPNGGTPPDIATLTPAQCRHIASELVWNHQAEPLPTPGRSLETMYTARSSPDPFIDADRMRFEAEVQGYYAQNSAEAERLASYIYALSAALYCENKSINATQVGFRFPIYPGDPDPGSRIKESEVILSE